MPSSLVLTGGAAFTRTVKETVSQSGHGFVQGDVLRWNSATSRYVKAQADNAMNAEVVGVVSTKFDNNSFELVYSGVIDISSLGGVSLENLGGVSAAPVLFLSAGVSGGLNTSPPSVIGSVVKPVLTKNKQNSYVVNNFLGTQIGGSSTVAIDEIQPIGTIMPYGGAEVPVSWLPCDGSAQDRVEYAELYSRLCFTDGDAVPMYGYIIGLTGTNFSLQVGDILHYKGNGIGAWTGTSAYDSASNDEVRAQVTAIPTATNQYLQVRVIPKYSNGKFSYSNIIMKNGVAAGPNFNYRAYRVVSGALVEVVGPTSATTLTVTNTALTHFLTPDLRGRFALGENRTVVGENSLENDASFISSLGQYRMASLGGEESHTLTSGEMPSHSHAAGTLATNQSGNHSHTIPFGDAGSAGEINNDGRTMYPSVTTTTSVAGNHTHTITGLVEATGANSPHNNMPPYLAVRYIIKAKPYTRAAIIDGVEIPYNNLLVRDLRTASVGGNAVSDLLICTNSNSAGGNGTERIRLKGDTGRIGIGKADPLVELDVNGWAAFSGRVGIGKTDPVVQLDVNGIAAFNVVGIGTRTPTSGIALDVVGSIKASTSLVLGNASFAAPSGSAPIFGCRAWVKITKPSTNSTTPVWVGGNIQSVVRNAMGDFTITFTTPLPSDYAVCGVGNETSTDWGTAGSGEIRTSSSYNPNLIWNCAVNLYNKTTTTANSCRVVCANLDVNNWIDPEILTLAFIG